MVIDEVKLSEFLSEAVRLRDAGARYSSVARLGAILNVVSRLEGPVSERWMRELHAHASPDQDTIFDAMERNKSRLLRILSIGGVWNEDEIALMLTIRIELDLVHSVVSLWGKQAPLDLSDADVALTRARCSAGNVNRFRSVEESVQRNWGLPIASRWLVREA
jgi:hypothetical protein